MRIAYLVTIDVSNESGVLKKILSQVLTWVSLGQEVRVFAISPSRGTWSGFKRAGIDITVSWVRHGLDRFRSELELYSSIKHYKPDVVYYRAGLYRPVFETLMRRFPTILEVNTYDVTEYKLMMSKVKYVYHCLTRGRLFGMSKGMVFVTNELAGRYSEFLCPKIVIPNGIMLSAYEPLPPTKNFTPNLCFIGSGKYPWYGIDKVLTLARRFPEWKFHIIGCREFNDSYCHNVVFHGYLTQKEYERILARCDVAIGSLALYRNGINEACPLKVREYLAYGLPVIAGYTDSDFPNGAPFILQIPNHPCSVETNAEKIEQFVLSWLGRRVPRSEVMLIDIQRKELERIRFIERVLSNVNT